jgi:hypothetical protein
MTGSGQFLIEKSEMPITRRRPYRLVWQQPIGWTDFDNVGAGHFGTVILAAATVNASRDDVHLAMLGDGGGVEAWNRFLRDYAVSLSYGKVFPSQSRVMVSRNRYRFFRVLKRNSNLSRG